MDILKKIYGKSHRVCTVCLVVKSPPANPGDIKDVGLILGQVRYSRGEHGNPLQCSCLENPMDGEAWWGYSSWGHKESDVTEATEYGHP